MSDEFSWKYRYDYAVAQPDYNAVICKVPLELFTEEDLKTADECGCRELMERANDFIREMNEESQ